MSDSRERISQLIDLLSELEPPTQPEAESWLRFTAERQELVDELQYLAERYPKRVTEIMHSGGRERIEAACSKIDEGMSNLALEARALRADLAKARQRRHKLGQHQRLTQSSASEGSLLGVG